MEICYGINEVEQVAKQLIEHAKTKTLLFYGGMGVGKTTLIKTIVRILGSDDDVNSPTFSIINEYKLKDEKIYHFDLYRINNLEDAYNFGIEDYLDSNHYIFIEWPEKIESILTEELDKISIEIVSEENRKLLLIK